MLKLNRSPGGTTPEQTGHKKATSSIRRETKRRAPSALHLPKCTVFTRSYKKVFHCTLLPSFNKILGLNNQSLSLPNSRAITLRRRDNKIFIWTFLPVQTNKKSSLGLIPRNPPLLSLTSTRSHLAKPVRRAAISALFSPPC